MNRSLLARAALATACLLAAGSCAPDYHFVRCGDPGGAPAVCIVDPQDEGILGPRDAANIVVHVVVSNYTLRPSNTCGVDSEGCGHIHITLKDANGFVCGAHMAGGDTYTNSGAGATIPISVASCVPGGQATGDFTITATLRNDDHSANLDAVGDEIAIRVGP